MLYAYINYSIRIPSGQSANFTLFIDIPWDNVYYIFMRYKMLLLLYFLIVIALHIYPLDLNVLMTDNRPLTYFDQETGRYMGVFVDLLEHIAEQEGWNIEYHMCSLNECLRLIQDPQYDMIADIGYSDERSELMLFNNESVYVTWAQIYSSRDITLTSFNDLKNTSIAVEESDFFLRDPHYGLEAILLQQGIDVQYCVKDGYRAVFEENAANRTLYSMVNRTFGEIHADEYGLHPTGLIFSPVSLRYAFNKDNISSYRIAAVIDKYLINMKSDEDSPYYGIMAKYLMPGVKEYYIPLWLIIVLILLVNIIIIIVFVYRHKIILERAYRTRMLADLFRQKQIQSVLLDIIPSGIIMVNEESRIIYANDSAAEALHLDKNSILNRTYDDSRWGIRNYDGKPIDKDNLPFNVIMHTGQCIKEYKHTVIDKKTGKTQYLSINGCPVFDNDRVIAVVFAIENITKFTLLNKNLLKSQKLEMISQISSSIMQHLVHILASIDKYAHDMKRHDDSSKRIAENILSSVELGRDLLEQVNMLGSRNHERPVEFDINQSLEKFISTAKAIIPDRISLVFMPSKQPLIIYADTNRINQMLLGLILNARDAISGSGSIEIKTMPKEDGGKGFCALSVSDNGKGMDNDVKNAMFKPFYSTKGLSGTGLGLYIVNIIVQSYNGRISVQTEQGSGTVFTILLPISN